MNKTKTIDLDKLEFNKTKYKIIKEYSDNDFMNILNSFNDKETRPVLKRVLEGFIPKQYRHESNNEKKFGIKTKQSFINSLKGKIIDIKEGNRIFQANKTAKKKFLVLYTIWLQMFQELSYLYENNDYDEFEPENTDFLELIIKGCREHKIPKETVEKIYKFYPFSAPDENIEKEIEELNFTQQDYINKLKKELEEKDNKIIKLETGLLEKETLYDFEKEETEKYKKEIAQYQDEINNQQQEFEEKDDEILNLQSELLDKDTLLERSKNEIEQYQNEIEQLKIKITNLEFENQDLKKAIPINSQNAEKIKQSLENKIKILEENNKLLQKQIDESPNYSTDSEEISKLKDEILELKNRYDKLKNMKIVDFDKKIQTDKKYQQIILSLILDNSIASKLVIKHLNLKEQVIQEGYTFYDNLFVEKKNEFDTLNKDVKELKEKHDFYIKQLTFKDAEKMPETDLKKQTTLSPFSYKVNNEFNYAQYFKKFPKFEKETFFIIEDETIIDTFEFKKYGIPIIRTSVEIDWHGVEDWFGYYKDGIFIPSKTQISDYYSFVKKNLDLPFGIIVFDNFNKIPPEVYIQTFIENMELNEKYPLVHPALAKDDKYINIQKLHNLKYFFIKSKDQNSFEIPVSMGKYILK